MANARVAFEVLNGAKPEYTREGKLKPGFKYIGAHMIFDKKWMASLLAKLD